MDLIVLSCSYDGMIDDVEKSMLEHLKMFKCVNVSNS